MLFYFFSYPQEIYNIRQLLLSLLLRVAPFMVPVVIATSSIMINRYTGAFFDLIFKDKHIWTIFALYASYFFFHLYIVFQTPFKIEWYTNVGLYYEEYYELFLIDSIVLFFLFIYSIYTSIKVFYYVQPKKLSVTIMELINVTLKQLNKNLFSAVSNQKKILPYLRQDLNNLISRFTNLTVTAVKFKDFDTIKDNVDKIGNSLWGSIIVQLNFNKDQEENLRNEIEIDFAGFKGYISPVEREEADSAIDKRISSITTESRISAKIAGQQVARVYKDIYESAFAAKEFYACDAIIKNLESIVIKHEQLPLDIVFQIYSELFEITLSYKYHGYTRDYCKKICEKINEIYIHRNFFASVIINNYDIYFILIKKCMEHKEANIQKLILECFKETFEDETNDQVKKQAYKNINHAGVYSLHIKSMGCFAGFIRFFVTKKLNLKELIEVFSDFLPDENNNEEDYLLMPESVIELLQENNVRFDQIRTDIFPINGDLTYYKLKFFVVFYGYYLLQVRIGSTRIPTEFRTINIIDSINDKVPADFIRTALLDLETHLKNWDKLFVNQSAYYFSEVAYQLIIKAEHSLIYEDILRYGETELLLKLSRKLRDY
jgi:hypothetical protein